MDKPKILVLDIETSPNLAYTWGIWKENIGQDQLLKTSEILCWAAKWYGQKPVFYGGLHWLSRKEMLEQLRELLDLADIVVHYNGRKFDIPTINKDLIIAGIKPPSPYKQVDLIETIKHSFRFQSNRLGFVCPELHLGEKEKHQGFNLWKECLAGNDASWKVMKKYNIKDVLITEKLYTKIKPWMQNHPRLYDVEERTCPFCSSHKVHRSKDRIAVKYKYTQYQCQECGKYYMGNRVKK